MNDTEKEGVMKYPKSPSIQVTAAGDHFYIEGNWDWSVSDWENWPVDQGHLRYHMECRGFVDLMYRYVDGRMVFRCRCCALRVVLPRVKTARQLVAALSSVREAVQSLTTTSGQAAAPPLGVG